MEVEKTSKGPTETNIDPRLQEEESTTGPIEEITKVQVDPSEPSQVVKIGWALKSDLAQQLMKFLCRNQNMFEWTHADMIGIHPEIIYYQ